ncbi:GAF and ANTAR domain-containing protein [Intrasporangium sp. YIM S08009]|uniref:GAF and ANTAR domain-containing protein n=1 Tax=Intrasporangium zincisolvens TaxID=3080018 RepID=UPI002B0599B3|nr:GAF and ANTAR domain-containing protein [Intrasporangium sp. YIM S08009]
MTELRPTEPATSIASHRGDDALDPGRAMGTMLEAAAAVIPHLNHLGTMVHHTPARVTCAFSDPFAAQMQALHLELEEGPGFEAVTTGLPVISDDIENDFRWPAYARAAAARGLYCQLSLPLLWEDRALGALSLFWTEPHLLDAATLTLAQGFAAQTAALVGLSREREHLTYALKSRQTIGNAVGVLMERHHLEAAAAFSVLQRISQDSNTKLRDVAEQFLRTGQLPNPTPSRRSAVR